LGKSFMESARHVGGQNRRSPRATVVGRERKERAKKEEERAIELVYGRRAPASLVTYYVTRADVVCPSDLAGSIGRHHPWCPSMPPGAPGRLVPYAWVQIWNTFHQIAWVQIWN
jgi:hypothetical protein